MKKKTSVGIYIKKTANNVIRFINHETLGDNTKNSSSMQVMFCSFISNNTPCYQKMIEEEFGIVSATASQIIKTMENDGLLTRTADPKDGRLKILTLTEKGQEVGFNRDKQLYSLDTAILKGVSEEDKKVFLDTLKIINKNVEINKKEDK